MEKPVPALVNVCALGIGVAVPRAAEDGLAELEVVSAHPDSRSAMATTATAKRM
jgi:hypothetical protein